jgi:N-acetylglucosamine repressor
MGGELGHVTVDRDGGLTCGCGNRGCIETVATDQAFARRVSKRVGKTMSIEQIVEASKSGQLDVRAELDETFEYLAIGAAAAINLFNPEALLLCSRMLDIDADALARLEKMILARALGPLRAGVKIVRAEGDTRLGAIANIIHHIAGTLGPVL